MATARLDIDGEITANWDTTTGANHWSVIDEDTASPTDADYIQTTTLTDDDRFSFGNTPANTNLVSQVDVRVRCGITDASDASYIAVSLYHSGNPGTQVGSTLNITTTNIGNNVGTLATVTKTWSGLSLTKAQADGLQVKFVFNNA